MVKSIFIHPTSLVDEPSNIGKGTKIWHFSHIMPHTVIGKDCIIGQNVFVGENVSIGNNVKLGNNVSVFDGVTLEDDVFCAPSCVFTNIKNPRSHISQKGKFTPTLVEKGSTIGANATIICGVTIGSYAFIGAGSVVTKDVPEYALVYGSPARVKGWVNKDGVRIRREKTEKAMQGTIDILQAVIATLTERGNVKAKLMGIIWVPFIAITTIAIGCWMGIKKMVSIPSRHGGI